MLRPQHRTGNTMDDLPNRLQPTLAGYARHPQWILAFSGGLDSTVLLHLLHQFHRAYAPEISFQAIYVHHGLQDAADDWQVHCQQQCDALGVPFKAVAVSVNADAGDGLEAAARQARYAALKGELAQGGLLFTAHHADDQVETLLLRMMRSSGLAGLVGMKPVARVSGMDVARPLLGEPREFLETYAQAHKLTWVEDASNQDLALSRNFVRRRLLPVLREHWANPESRLLTLAQSLQDSQSLVDEIAAQDLVGCSDPDRWGPALALDALNVLSEARIKNLVTFWLHGLGVNALRQRQWKVLLNEVINARHDANPELQLSEGRLGRYQGKLYWIDSLTIPTVQSWQIGQQLDMGGLGRLSGTKTGEGGLAPGDYQVGWRQGGESLQPAGSKNLSLKQYFQDLGVPTWWRPYIPLLCRDGRIAAVADLCVCEGFSVSEGYRVEWHMCLNSD